MICLFDYKFQNSYLWKGYWEIVLKTKNCRVCTLMTDKSLRRKPKKLQSFPNILYSTGRQGNNIT